MRKSRLSKEKQGRLMEHFVSGSTARCVSELVNVNKNTAAYFFHRLREHHRVVVIHSFNKDAKIFFGAVSFGYQNTFYFKIILFRWHSISKMV